MDRRKFWQVFFSPLSQNPGFVSYQLLILNKQPTSVKTEEYLQLELTFLPTSQSYSEMCANQAQNNRKTGITCSSNDRLGSTIGMNIIHDKISLKSTSIGTSLVVL